VPQAPYNALKCLEFEKIFFGGKIEERKVEGFPLLSLKHYINIQDSTADIFNA
jgi:hypothetical protein